MQRLDLVSPRNMGFSSSVSARALIGATPALPSGRRQRGTRPHCIGTAVRSPWASSFPILVRIKYSTDVLFQVGGGEILDHEPAIDPAPRFGAQSTQGSRAR